MALPNIKAGKPKEVRSVYDLLTASTSTLSEDDRKVALDAILPIICEDFKDKVFVVNGPSVMTASMPRSEVSGNPEDDARLYKKVSLVGGEQMTLEGWYLGKARGVIFKFRPTPGCVLGYEQDKGELILETGIAQCAELIYVEPNSDQAGTKWVDYIKGRYADTDVKKTIADEKQRVEDEKELAELEELAVKQEAYGDSWGGWG